MIIFSVPMDNYYVSMFGHYPAIHNICIIIISGCSKVAGWITPVPGGVGPMTVAMLMKNTLQAALGDVHYNEF